MVLISRRIGDGRCVFDIVMKGRAPTEITSGPELANAGRVLFLRCVGIGGGVGGMLSNIGKSASTIRENAASSVSRS